MSADPDSGSFPAGFETGDAALDRAIRVLRMLFVKVRTGPHISSCSTAQRRLPHA